MTEDRFGNETTAHGSTTSKEEVAVVRFEESNITFPYKRSLGPVIGAFMTALTEKKILGIRNGDGVLVPPMEWDPATGAELPRELIEVGPAGTIESWTWVPIPRSSTRSTDHSPSLSSGSTGHQRRCSTPSILVRRAPWPTA